VIAVARVAVVARIFPEDADRIEELGQRLMGELKPNKMDVEEIGFGVKALKVTFILSDEEGGDIEERIRRIKGVSEVQVEGVDRL